MNKLSTPLFALGLGLEPIAIAPAAPVLELLAVARLGVEEELRTEPPARANLWREFADGSGI